MTKHILIDSVNLFTWWLENYQLGWATKVLDMLIPNYQRKLYPDDK